ncbi:DUF6350 family protein [Actinophytocola sp.]|uniref:cell division protein PerM n=1 Tax=Actinophytocola sp. TaxID=1872138 RepID=UPI00389A8248
MAPDLEGSTDPGPAPDDTHSDPTAGSTPAEDTAAEGLTDGTADGGARAEDVAEAAAEPEPEPCAEVDAGPPPEPVSGFTRFRAVTALAVGPLATGYLTIATLLAVVAGSASNSRFTTAGVLVAALPGWLAAHQVPIEIYGLELGVLPLLPTLGLVVLTAMAAARAAARLGLYRPGQARLVIGTVAVAHGLAGLVVAGVTVDAEVTADPTKAICYPALVSALAATVGVARRCGLLAALRRKADAVAVAGLRAGARAVLLLLAAGGALLVFGLATSVPAAKALVPAGAGDAVGMLLLSLGYLPNAVVAATAFVAGPGFALGTFAVAPLEFHGGALPGVPLLAALPEHRASWWPALFVLPLVIGVVVGRRLRDADEAPVARLRGVAVATGVIAVSLAALAEIAGGRLGKGPFDPISMPAAALFITLVVWTAAPGAFVAWFGGPRPVPEPLPSLTDDEDDPEPAEEIADPDPDADPDAALEDERDAHPNAGPKADFKVDSNVERDADPSADSNAECDAAADAEPKAESDTESDEQLARTPGQQDPTEDPAELPSPRDAVEESGEVARD